MVSTYYALANPDAAQCTDNQNFSASTVENLLAATEQMIQYYAALTLYNALDSGKIVRLKQVQLIEKGGGVNNPVGADLMYAIRTTAQDGGEPLCVTKMNSLASALPATVLVSKYPGVTESGSRIRSAAHGPVVQLLGNTFPNVGRFIGAKSTAELLRGNDDNVQSVTLREGEGIAINVTAPAVQRMYPMTYHVTLRVAGESYVINETLLSSRFGPAIGIFNGTGSGVIVYVDRVEVTDENFSAVTGMSSNVCPRIEIESIAYAANGIAVPVRKHDSSAPACPSGVKVWRNAGIVQTREDSLLKGRSGFGISSVLNRHCPTWFGFDVASGPGYTFGMLAAKWGRESMFRSSELQSEYVLRAGEGIAIGKAGVNSPLVSWDQRLVFTVEDAPPAAATGVSRSRIFARS